MALPKNIFVFFYESGASSLGREISSPCCFRRETIRTRSACPQASSSCQCSILSRMYSSAASRKPSLVCSWVMGLSQMSAPPLAWSAGAVDSGPGGNGLPGRVLGGTIFCGRPGTWHSVCHSPAESISLMLVTNALSERALVSLAGHISSLL